MEQVNQYIKQFPELMQGKKILYVHGFASSGQSGTVRRIREVMPSATVIAPDLPIHPQEAIDLLKEVCQREQPDLIIGTSMGGMYAEMLRGYDRILVNPAFQMGDTMKAHDMMGAQHFQNPRLDGVQDFIVTKSLVKEYREMTEQCFLGIDEAEQQRVTGLFGDEDTLVDTFDIFRQHYPRATRFHGEHRMNDRSFMHAVMPVVRWIDDRQEGRQREIVYIDIEAARRTGAPKVIRQLIETYQVYFVAPATADVATYQQTLDWLYDHVNVPAWEHTVFTCRKDLLYGDFLIDHADTESMGTLIRFGSDTFKTWESIGAYFQSLTNH